MNNTVIMENHQGEGAMLEECTKSTQAIVASEYALLGKIVSAKKLNRKTVKLMLKRGWGEPEGWIS